MGARKDQPYDTDSFLIAIDTGCSYCMTNSKAHFVGKTEPIRLRVKGIGGEGTATMKGTVVWSVTNDEGQIQELRIPNTYYNKDAPYCLLSPQHMAQATKDDHPMEHGTYCVTNSGSVTLFWKQATQKKTIKLDRATNIPLMRSAPGHKRFHNFCTLIEQEEATALLTSYDNDEEDSPGVVTDYESDDEEVDGMSQGTITEETMCEEENTMQMSEQVPDRRHPDLPDTVFEKREVHPGPKLAIRGEDEEVQGSTPQAELLAWHYRLGHLPFDRIKRLAERGDLPARLAKCKAPKCGVSIRATYTESMEEQATSERRWQAPQGHISRSGRIDRSDDISDSRDDCPDERMDHPKAVHHRYGIRGSFQRNVLCTPTAIDYSNRDSASKKSIRAIRQRV